MRHLLLRIGARLRIQRLWRPLHVQHRVERRRTVVARELHVSAALDHQVREVEVAVDDGHEQGARLVARADLIDVGARVEERGRGIDVTLTSRKQERRQPTLGAHQLVEAILPRHAGDVWPTVRRSARGRRVPHLSAALAGACACPPGPP